MHSIRFATAIAAALLLAAPALADDRFSGAGQQGELDCGGGTATIEGADNDMVVTGNCTLLVIQGATNRVRVQMARNGVIRITGAANEVVWSTPDRSKPKLRIAGAANRVTGK